MNAPTRIDLDHTRDNVRAAAPTPAESGCADTNAYTYDSDGSTYSIEFCLGAPVGALAGGVHTASPNGIE